MHARCSIPASRLPTFISANDVLTFCLEEDFENTSKTVVQSLYLDCIVVKLLYEKSNFYPWKIVLINNEKKDMSGTEAFSIQGKECTGTIALKFLTFMFPFLKLKVLFV